MFPPPGRWVLQAKCRGSDLDSFFPEVSRTRTKATDIGPALELCAQCPVLDQCSSYADTHPEVTGIWGGAERRGPVKQRRPAQIRVAGHTVAHWVDSLAGLEARPGKWAQVGRWNGKHTAFRVETAVQQELAARDQGQTDELRAASNRNGSTLWARQCAMDDEQPPHFTAQVMSNNS
jgi:WhiB family transcriptional regulator, redox-sensing transcriptional regulator